jgi:hypothetical protein
MLQLHPDKLSPRLSEGEIAAVTEKFHNVKDAYEFLTSPQYLTARRLYQAKMASKRAEYERREAFLRRAGNGSSNHTVRTRMTEAPDPAAQAAHARRRQSSHAVDRPRPHRRAARGYTSDGARPNPNRPPSHAKRAPRSDQPPAPRRGSAKREGRTRAESEPRTRRQRQHDGESDADDRARFKGRSNRGKASNGSDDNGGRRRSRERGGRRQEQQRARAKSAPARCRDERNSRNNPHNSKLPKEFYCPLSKRVMKDPVVDPDGNAYEREAIERWLRVQSSSPITNGYLSVDMLRPSTDLKNRIYKLVGQYRTC